MTDKELEEQARKFEGFEEQMSEPSAAESAGRYHGFLAGARYVQNENINPKRCISCGDNEGEMYEFCQDDFCEDCAPSCNYCGETEDSCGCNSDNTERFT